MPALHLALWEPEIPPNTGNIARLCAATQTTLHLVGRLGFRLDEKSLRRAGLDYWPHVQVHQHASLADFEQYAATIGLRLVCIETTAPLRHTQFRYQPGDCLLLGSETRGLPTDVVQRNQAVFIPMPGSAVRSLNLATAAGIALYEALRQVHNW
jgi:tRNA (cytidine/uridine-2'-O-)-methyltransferase